MFFRYLDLEKIVNKLRRRLGGSTSGSSFIWGDLTITGHKAVFICGQDLFLKSVTNCTDYIYLSKHRKKLIENFFFQFWNCLICNLLTEICCNLAGLASNRYGWPDLQTVQQRLASLASLVSASHWKNNKKNNSELHIS